jgi:hypothetical protein
MFIWNYGILCKNLSLTHTFLKWHMYAYWHITFLLVLCTFNNYIIVCIITDEIIMPGKKRAPATSKTPLRQIKVSSTQYIYFSDSWNEEDKIHLFNKHYDICLIRILTYDYLINWISWQIKRVVGYCVVIQHFLVTNIPEAPIYTHSTLIPCKWKQYVRSKPW